MEEAACPRELLASQSPSSSAWLADLQPCPLLARGPFGWFTRFTGASLSSSTASLQIAHLAWEPLQPPWAVARIPSPCKSKLTPAAAAPSSCSAIPPGNFYHPAAPAPGWGWRRSTTHLHGGGCMLWRRPQCSAPQIGKVDQHMGVCVCWAVENARSGSFGLVL